MKRMNAKVCLSVALFLISLLAFPLLSQGAPPGTVRYGQGDYLDVSKQTWIEYPTPIKDPLGHPTRPWQPKGEYPWRQPYSATMLAYFVYEHGIFTGQYFDYSGISARLNKRGLMTQRKFYSKLETMYTNFRDLMQYDEDKDGKVGLGGRWNRRMLIYETPADVRGLGNLTETFLNSPVAGWKMMNSWTYSPNLRRVTRSQGGDRQDEVLGTPVTNDDVFGSREVWEEDHFLIGEDVLYTQFLDPQMIAPDREFNTGDFKKDGEWLAKNLNPLRGEEQMSPYRPDGGIECWVVLSQWVKRREGYGSFVFPDPKQYYLKYRLTWVEKVAKIPLRQEQYDHDDRLIKNGFSFNPEFFAGDFTHGGNNRTQYQMYDYRRHFRSWGSYDRANTGPKYKAPNDWYTAEHLFREHFWRKGKLPMYKSVKEFTPPPELWRAKFPRYRKGVEWLLKSKEDMEYMNNIWKEHGFTEEEIDAMQNGDGMIRKGGKAIPVRRNFRPPHIHGKPLPVKFPAS